MKDNGYTPCYSQVLCVLNTNMLHVSSEHAFEVEMTKMCVVEKHSTVGM